MNSLARFEYVSLVPEAGRDEFSELDPPPRVWTEAEVEAERAEAETRGRSLAEVEARTGHDARIADAIEGLARQASALRDQMTRIEADIRKDAATLARTIAGRIAGEALRNDSLSVVEPIIEATLSELTGKHRLRITVHDVLRGAIDVRTRDLAEHIGFEGGISVSGGGEHLTDCRLEWGAGASERSVQRLNEEIDRQFVAHGYPSKFEDAAETSESDDEPAPDVVAEGEDERAHLGDAPLSVEELTESEDESAPEVCAGAENGAPQVATAESPAGSDERFDDGSSNNADRDTFCETDIEPAHRAEGE